MSFRSLALKTLTAVFLAFLAISSSFAQEPDPGKETVILVASPKLGQLYAGTVLVAIPRGNIHVGFIINRPTQVTLGRLFPEHGPSAKVKDPVFFGGPVRVYTISAVAKFSEKPPDKSAIQVTGNLWLALEVNLVDRVIEEKGDEAKYLAGMVGWQPGELQSELSQGMWKVLPADPEIIMKKDTSKLWDELKENTGTKV